MPYLKYFKTDQKLLLHPITEDDQDRVENLTAYFIQANSGRCDLRLPYQNRPGEEFPFTEGMKVELTGEAMGLGVRMTGSFESYLDKEKIRLSLNDDLQAFQRRIHKRGDVQIGLRYTKGHGTLRTFRQQWEKNVRILSDQRNVSKLGQFPRCSINLGAGGLRFALKPPINIADLCMVLMEIEPKTPPICALAEVVWIADGEAPDSASVGMQFINILKSDQQRIESYLENHGQVESRSPNKAAS